MTAKGYWIAHNVVHDVEAYDKYRAANAAPLAEYGAKFLVRGGQQELREGTWNTRTVVIEFPSYADAVACYESDGYQVAKAMRVDVSDGNMIIVEGYLG
ncbi:MULTISPECIES: DUF1330 domain-containing protein [Rhodobacterales]|uniref:DUF1330 domain-containing protein n=1 Tax=Rhodobacterales TaxID=204455 RepID=UPI003296EA22